MNTLQPIVQQTSVLPDQLRALLGRFQVLVALVLVIPQGLIAFGILELASDIEPMAMIQNILLLQAMLFASDKLDNMVAIRAVVKVFEAIEFKDRRINELFDMLNQLLGNQPTEENTVKGGFTAQGISPEVLTKFTDDTKKSA